MVPARKILAIGVEVPKRARELDAVISALAKTRHHLIAKKASMLKGKGKFQNVNEVLSGIQMDGFDWLIVLDDDIALPHQFLDRFIYLAESANLEICQPAHEFGSYQSFEMTERRKGSLLRITNFVECGPLTAFHRPTFHHILPFPDLRWAWGTDVYWSDLAHRENFRIGIVDNTPVTHLRPVAGSYDGNLAMQEGASFLREQGIKRGRTSILVTKETIRR